MNITEETWNKIIKMLKENIEKIKKERESK